MTEQAVMPALRVLYIGIENSGFFYPSSYLYTLLLQIKQQSLYTVLPTFLVAPMIRLSRFWPPISRTRLVTFAPRFAAIPPQGLDLLDLLWTQPRKLLLIQGNYD